MKRIFLWAICLAACSPAGAEGWKLVWADEFDKPGLVDEAKWNYEKGFVRNHEAQYYTVARKENARVEDGCLVIEGRKEEYTAPDGTKAHYTAANLDTLGKFSFAYGRVEVRARLPRGRGMWPAIWAMGTNIHAVGWPKCGELDIMETVGYNEGNVPATVHWFNYGKKAHDSKGSALSNQTPFADFHVYAMEWNADAIDFFYDGQKYFSYPVSLADSDAAENPFKKPHYLLINLAIGGEWGGQKGIDDSVFPQKYLIDYVRVYEAVK